MSLELEIFENFCDTPFWNYNLAWNTTSPNLTPCFIDTGVAWIAPFLLWITVPYSLYDYAISKRVTIVWNWMNVFKIIVAAMLACVGVIQLIHVFVDWNTGQCDSVYNATLVDEIDKIQFESCVSTAQLVATLVNAATFLMLVLYIHLQRLFGFVNCGAIWFYLLLQVFTSAVSIYAANVFRPHISYYYVELLLQVVLFFVCSFPDGVPNLRELMSSGDLYGVHVLKFAFDSDDIDDDKDLKLPINSQANLLCPKETASFPSKLTFWWFNSLSYLGFRRALTTDDLWEIRRTDRSQNLFQRFNCYWRHKSFQSHTNIDSIDKSDNNDQDLQDESKASLLVKRSFNGKQTYSISEYDLLNNDRTNCDTDPEPEPVSNQPKPKKIKSNIFFILTKMFWFYFLLPSVARLCTDLLQLANPMVLKFMISFTTDLSAPFWHGVFFSLIFVITNVVQSLTSAYHQHRMSVLGMRVRSCLIGAIYRKSLVLAMHAKRDFTTGEIVNLMAVDSQRFIDLVPFICFLWTAPIQIAIALWLLWNELGASVIGGLVLMILFIPINGYVAGRVKKIQGKQMHLKDQRLKAINEMLNGIKVLKLYAWEEAFIKNIQDIRIREINYIRKSGFISTIFVCISACSPFMVSCLTFAIYVLSDPSHELNAEKAFVSIALFNLLRIPLTMIPNMLTNLILTLVSLKRLNNFLNCDEVDNYVTRNFMKQDAVRVSKASFSWDMQPTGNPKTDSPLHVPTLSNIDLQIKKGSLVAVVGSVGSGKSSFLYALLGEMQKLKGSVNISRELKLAYVAQQAWIQNSTVRGNILFGAEFDEIKYDRVIRACALKPDFEMLTGGDQTEIGEKGINLSGGQKQRISIARACYSDADLYLFDDPLSAVDSHVGKHIFDEVLSSNAGILQGKTRVLVTNALYMLPNVDTVVLLKNGTVDDVGSYQELLDNNKNFSDLITNYTNSADSEEPVPLEEFVTETTEHTEMVTDLSTDFDDMARLVRTISQSSNILASKERHHSNLLRQLTRSSSTSPLPPAESKPKADMSKLVEAENVETGQITFSVYKKFFVALSPFWSILIFVNYFLIITANTGSSFWLSAWTEDVNDSQDTTNYRLGIYFVIGMGQIFFVSFGWLSIIKGTLKASRTLHWKLISSIVHAPMHFFDTTPLGRIVNRFSKDIDILDSYMQFLLRVLLNTTFQVLATLFIISLLTPIFLAFVVPFLALYYFIQRFYVSTSRQLKRLESVTRSPILTHFSETINGVSTIKAYNATERFIYESDKRVDQNQRCFYPSAVANCWLQVRLEFLANCLIFFAAFFVAFSKKTTEDGDGLTGSKTGLSLSYALNVTLSLNWCVRMFADLENNVVSVERISEYTDVPPEAPWKIEQDSALSKEWPDNGIINFNNYATRYRPGLDLVLKGIDLSIKSGEKIGIVGRTGAGKSSLTLALFRIIEASHGEIIMDNVNISKLGLHQLRSRITIIPQDPVLFCGNLRFNLDPFNAYDDSELWTVLELSHLKSFVSSLELGLQHPVSESGENLSVGQRQLICLARALLRRTKVLVLDEATAAVDLETDSLIQQTIRSEFSHCTVLTIAHRLNTILDSDRVLVLDAGKVAEFESPKVLLADDTSIFYSLAKDAGIV